MVSIAYPNSPTVGSLCDASSDSLCFDKVRQEICYGTPVSTLVSVDTFNCINTRLVKLLQFLLTTYPTDGWGQFLTGNIVTWNTIVTSGHSQGSGHAMYLAKTQAVNRVAMFSGVDDFSTHFNKPAHWIYNSGLTPISSIYSFLHLQDDVEPYPHEYSNMQALGLMSTGDDSTIVDNKTIPYNNSHCLYTNVTPPHVSIPSSYHDATVVDYFTPLSGSIPLYTPVWTYMLTTGSTSSINQLVQINNTLLVYPNPGRDKITLSFNNNIINQIDLKIVNQLGNIVLNQTFSENLPITISLSQFCSGVYFVYAVVNNQEQYHEKIIISK